MPMYKVDEIEDVNSVFNLVEMFANDTKQPYDKDYLYKAFEDYKYNPMKRCFVLYEDSTPVGFICLMKYQHPFFDRYKVCNEIAFFCLVPGKGKLLIKQAEEWAKDCKWISLCHMGNDRIGKYYERLGYKKQEVTYIKETGVK